MKFEPRFIKYTKKTPTCWLWIGACAGGKKSDYGVIRVNAKQCYAHRAAYEFYKGPIPEGYQVDHLCRNRKCVNPDHLEPVTQKENLLRGIGIPAVNIKKTHCVNGHEYTKENIYWTGPDKKHRSCVHCRNLHNEKLSLKRFNLINKI